MLPRHCSKAHVPIFYWCDEEEQIVHLVDRSPLVFEYCSTVAMNNFTTDPNQILLNNMSGSLAFIIVLIFTAGQDHINPVETGGNAYLLAGSWSTSSITLGCNLFIRAFRFEIILSTIPGPVPMYLTLFNLWGAYMSMIDSEDLSYPLQWDAAKSLKAKCTFLASSAPKTNSLCLLDIVPIRLGQLVIAWTLPPSCSALLVITFLQCSIYSSVAQSAISQPDDQLDEKDWDFLMLNQLKQHFLRSGLISLVVWMRLVGGVLCLLFVNYSALFSSMMMGCTFITVKGKN